MAPATDGRAVPTPTPAAILGVQPGCRPAQHQGCPRGTARYAGLSSAPPPGRERRPPHPPAASPPPSAARTTRAGRTPPWSCLPLPSRSLLRHLHVHVSPNRLPRGPVDGRPFVRPVVPHAVALVQHVERRRGQ